MKSSRILSRLAVFFVGIFFSGSGHAQEPAAGDLDLSFSADGKALVTYPGYTSQAYAMDVQPDGKVIVAGQAWAGGATTRMLVTRFTAEGELDTTFGTQGFMTYIASGNQSAAARVVKVLSNGQILVGGDVGASFTMFRLSSSGTLDGTFSLQMPSFGVEMKLTSVAVQADGKVLLGGQSRTYSYSEWDGFVYRVTSNGSRDTGFNNGGSYVYSGSGDQTVRSLCIQPDGKIVYGGTSSNTSFYIGRLTTSGTADTSFANYYSNVGRFIFSLSSSTSESVESLALDGSNHIVALATHSGTADDVSMIRLTPEGALDTFFSTDGHLTTTFGGVGGVPLKVCVQADGCLVIGGYQPNGGSPGIRLRRFLWNGEVDSSFGIDGLLSQTLGSSGTDAAGLTVLSDRKLVVAGSAVESGFFKGLAALRLHPGPALSLPTITITQEPEAQTREIGQPVTFSVEATLEGDTPAVYSWYRGNTLLSRDASPTLSLTSVTASMEGNYRVDIRMGAVSKSSASVFLKVPRPPVITGDYSLPMTFLQNSSASITVSYTGRLPVSYKWFKGTEEIASSSYHNSSYVSLGLSPFLPENIGKYKVEITNVDGTATSPEIEAKLVTDPAFMDLPTVLVSLGQTITLSPTILSSQQFRTQWSQNGKTISGGEDGVYEKNDATLSDAGSYTARVVSLRGSGISDPMKVGVVDTRAHKFVAAQGKKFQLAIPVAGPGLSFTWYKNESEEPLAEKTGLSGLDKAVLSFNNITEEDAGFYRCVVELNGLNLETEVQEIVVTDAVPFLSEVTLPAGRIGLTYDVALPLPLNAGYFEVKGLPAGLVFSKDTSRIMGTPAKVGSFPLSITAVNPVGRSITIKPILHVLALPDGFSGRFVGLFSDEVAGDFDITITATGTYSGKMNLSNLDGKAVRASFSGKLATDSTSLPEGSAPSEYWSSTAFTLKGYVPVSGASMLVLRVMEGSLTFDVEIPSVDEEGNVYPYMVTGVAMHCPWNAKQPLDPSYQGVFNLGFSPSETPAGYGYARATVAANGNMSIVGKLSDGTAVTASAPVAQDFNAYGIRYLYGNRGYMSYSFAISQGTSAPDYLDASVSGWGYWKKNAVSIKGQTNYPVSFSGSYSIADTNCGKYLKPKHPSGLVGDLMMNSPSSDIYVTVAGYLHTATLGLNHSLKFSTEEEGDANSMGLKSLKFNAATGIFSGSATMIYYDYYYDEETGEEFYIRRKLPYKMEGIVTRESTSLVSRASGFCLIPEWFQLGDEDKYYRLKASYPVSVSY